MGQGCQHNRQLPTAIELRHLTPHTTSAQGTASGEGPQSDCWASRGWRSEERLSGLELNVHCVRGDRRSPAISQPSVMQTAHRR